MKLPKDLEEMATKLVFLTGWPKGATMEIKLGKKEFFLPTKGKNGLLEMKKVKAVVTCRVRENGLICFKLRKFRILSWIFLNIFTCGIPALRVYWDIDSDTAIPEIKIEDDLICITDSVLFRQFRKEIFEQAEKCLPLARSKQDVAVEFLKDVTIENDATLKGRARVARDLEVGMERVRRDLGARSVPDLGEPETEDSSALILPPTPESVKN